MCLDIGRPRVPENDTVHSNGALWATGNCYQVFVPTALGSALCVSITGSFEHLPFSHIRMILSNFGKKLKNVKLDPIGYFFPRLLSP